MAKNKRSVSAATFDRVAPQLGISSDRVSAARAVMVDGEPVGVVASRFGWTSQAVSICVKLVWLRVESFGLAPPETDGMTLPPGWERFSFIAPSPFVEEVRKRLFESSFLGGEARKPGPKPGAKALAAARPTKKR